MVKYMCKKPKHHSIRWISALLGTLFIILCTGNAAAASSMQEERTLRVAFPVSPGISEIDQYGNHKGLLVDYLNEIAKYTGWNYEYIDVEADDLINDFQAGKYDLMGGAFYSPGFEEYFAYPNYNTGRSRAVLLCRWDNVSLRSYDLTSLNGKTIGVNDKATEKIRHLEDFLKSYDLDCQIKYYTRDDMDEAGTLYRQLREGEVDMLLGNELEADGEFRMVTSFQGQPHYIVTTIGNQEVLDGLNMALEHIWESYPSFAEETYNANFPDINLPDIIYNEKELRYIAEKEMISVAVVKSWHPLYCLDIEGDHHNGLIPDLLQKISNYSGLKFTYVSADTYADAVRLVQEGEADILGAYIGAEEQAFSEGLALSRPYISLNNIVLKNKAVSYPDNELTCGILTGRILPDDLEAAKIRSYATIPEMVSAVNSGEVDYIYGMSAMLEQEIQNHRYLNVVPVSRVDNSTAVAFAAARPITPELLTILNKTISSLPTEERSAMLDRNLVSIGYSSLSLQEWIYANPVAFTTIISIALFLIMVGFLLVIRSKVKNTLMKGELDAAKVKSQAKSDFLSRMSHEIRTPMNAIVGLTDLTCMEPDVPGKIADNLQKIRSSSQYLLSLINDILDMSRIENEKMEIRQEHFSLVHMLEALEEMMHTQAQQKSLQFHVSHRILHPWLIGDSVRLRQVLTNLLSNAIKFTPEGGKVSFLAEETECDGQAASYRFSVIDTGVGIAVEDQEKIFTSFEQLGSSTTRSAGTGLGLPISRSIVHLMGGDIQVTSTPGEGTAFHVFLRFPLGLETETSASAEASAAQRSLEGINVLLAEDNDLNAEIAEELLATQGIKVRRAVNGQEALDLFTASKPGEYQIILMDIRMPVKDGQEAARDIRSCGRPDADVPIIAMTANSFREDEEAALNAGMTGFVPKPVNPSYLFSILQQNL